MYGAPIDNHPNRDWGLVYRVLFGGYSNLLRNVADGELKILHQGLPNLKCEVLDDVGLKSLRLRRQTINSHWEYGELVCAVRIGASRVLDAGCLIPENN